MLSPSQRSLFLFSLAVALTAPGCFVSIDESLLDQEPPAEGEDADANKPDVKADTKETGPEKDVVDDESVSPDADASVEASPDADASEDTADAPESSEASDDADAAEGDVMADGDAAEADVVDETDAPDDVTPDVEEAGETGEPLKECYDDTWCQPNGCILRTCSPEGLCVEGTFMKQVAATFDLGTDVVLACPHSHNSNCVTAVNNYLVTLTETGLLVFNVRNPAAPTPEVLPSNLDAGYTSLVRSGSRIWAIKPNGPTTFLARLDLPLSGHGPLAAPTIIEVTFPSVTAAFAAPNDGIYLFTNIIDPPSFGLYTPGLLANVTPYEAVGALETDAVASSDTRILMHGLDTIDEAGTSYQHRFSLQSSVDSPTSANSGSYAETSLTSGASSPGFFAYSRGGAVAWSIGNFDLGSAVWTETRAFWLIPDRTGTIDSENPPPSVPLETYGALAPPVTPAGPIAFLDEDTVAVAAIRGVPDLPVSVDIVNHTDVGPTLDRRIPVPGLQLPTVSLAGDSGFAYVVSETTVTMIAPACSP